MNVGEYFTDTTDSDENDSNRHLNDAVSMEWDALGTDLEEDSSSYHPIQLDRAVNLNSVLPLTSTPNYRQETPHTARRQRISMPRRPLPLEMEVNEGNFLSRLNPFKKKRK